MSKTTKIVSPIFIILQAIVFLTLPACEKQRVERHHKVPKISTTSPEVKAVTITQRYIGNVHSQHHIKIRAMAKGYLEEVPIKEGQMVKEGDLLFKVKPILNRSKQDVENAEAKLPHLQPKYTKKLNEDKEFTQNEAMLEARQAQAKAKAQLAAIELDFATVKAPFGGIVDHLIHPQGAWIQEGEELATLSDNSLTRVYFNVPEVRYLEFMTDVGHRMDDLQIELILQNGKKFDQIGKLNPIQADFNGETGNIPFSADFPNPDRQLRHGQNCTVSISRVQNDAVVIPKDATFQILNKRYVYIVDKDNVAHQREIVIQNDVEDLYVIKKGVSVGDKIILEGVGHVYDGEKVEYEDPVQNKG